MQRENRPSVFLIRAQPHRLYRKLLSHKLHFEVLDLKQSSLHHPDELFSTHNDAE